MAKEKVEDVCCRAIVETLLEAGLFGIANVQMVCAADMASSSTRTRTGLKLIQSDGRAIFAELTRSGTLNVGLMGRYSLSHSACPRGGC